MSDIEKSDQSDLTAGRTPTPSNVTHEAVITAPEQQASLTAKSGTGSYNLQNLDFVDAKIEPAADGHPPGYEDLVYRYTEDPLQKGIGKVALDFDSITKKMGEMLKHPEIDTNHKFSMQQLKDTIEHPELAKRFSAIEIQSLRLMANQARRLAVVDPAEFSKLDPKVLMQGKLPMDKIYISHDSVHNAGKKLGVFQDI